jgi:uncharacterized protein YigA (DUF484 family)
MPQSLTPPSAIGSPITEDDIANYLANTPEFFERHAELLAAIHLSSPHSQRTVSLQERQAALLRDKIRMLEQRIMDMIRNVNENMVLSDKLLMWARSLLLNADALALPQLIADEIADQFSVPQVGIKVWGVAQQFASEPFALGVRAIQRQTFLVHLQRSAVGGERQGGWAMQTLADVVGHQRFDRTTLLQGPLFHLLHQVIRKVQRCFHGTSIPGNQFTGLLGRGQGDRLDGAAHQRLHLSLHRSSPLP